MAALTDGSMSPPMLIVVRKSFPFPMAVHPLSMPLASAGRLLGLYPCLPLLLLLHSFPELLEEFGQPHLSGFSDARVEGSAVLSEGSSEGFSPEVAPDLR